MLRQSSRRARSRFWIRTIGSTGLFLALLGLIPLSTTISLRDTGAWNAAISRFISELTGFTFTSRFQAISLAMIGVGGAMFLFSLAVQMLGGARTLAGRRNMAAMNSTVQIALLAALLIGVNAWSFRHYFRWDWTRHRQFTLPANITDELAKLRGQTDIIVYQRHKTFGRLSDKPDAYDYAAERKVVEKVQDLVEQFREFGPQFRVEVLDIESEGYETRLDALTQDAPSLRAALDAAPENSIFFHARRQFGTKPDGKPDFRENVQRLSFNEFYELDKTDSLGKSVIVLVEKKADKNEDQNLATVERKVRRFVDPDAPAGPDIKLFVIRSDDVDAAKVREQAAVEAPALKALLEAAAKDRNADNSVFVFKDGKPSQSSFAVFAAKSDARARDALRPRGNLVLVPQGVAAFARKVLAVEERRPRVAFAVIHEWLTTDGLDEFTLKGAKNALTMAGFDVEDIILKKKWGESAEPEAAAYTLEETKYERVLDDLAEVNDSLDSVAAGLRQLTAALELFRTAPLDDLTRRYRQQLGGRPFTEELRQRQIAAITADLQTLDYVVRQNSEARKQYEQEKLALGEQENLVEARRMTDLKAKMAKLLGECDLLIIPRMTLRDVISGYAIPPRYYRLDDVQTAAIKEFLTAGKPVLACFGPINEPPDRRAPPTTGTDSIEQLLGQFGIMFSKQTVLFGSEGKALAERRSNPLATGSSVKIPPLRFDAPPSTLWLSTGDVFTSSAKTQPQPIASSMEVTHRSIGAKHKLELDARHPRPIYFVPVRPKDLLGTRVAQAEFLFTDPDGWNEDQPFPTQQRTPRFEPPKPDDPSKGTRDERRRGSFPVGIALETTVPIEWTDPQAAALKVAAVALAGAEPDPAGAIFSTSMAPTEWFAKPGTQPTLVRLAAIGHGGWFVGAELSPPKEELLVTICNWLLRRDERLPTSSAEPWRYPRVTMSERDQSLWRWGTRLALPGLFVYLGSMVLLRRRYR
jgi:hypothetical protein